MSVEEVAVEIQDADELLYMLTVESKFRQIRLVNPQLGI